MTTTRGALNNLRQRILSEEIREWYLNQQQRPFAGEPPPARRDAGRRDVPDAPTLAAYFKKKKEKNSR